MKIRRRITNTATFGSASRHQYPKLFQFGRVFSSYQSHVSNRSLECPRYVPEVEEPFGSGGESRLHVGYSGGVRLDYTYVHSKEHLIKAGFQVDRTWAINH